PTPMPEKPRLPRNYYYSVERFRKQELYKAIKSKKERLPIVWKSIGKEEFPWLHRYWHSTIKTKKSTCSTRPDTRIVPKTHSDPSQRQILLSWWWTLQKG